MKEQKKTLLCDCGSEAIVGVRKVDEWKYVKDAIPDMRRRLWVCLECWCKWEDEHGYRQTASAVWCGA